MTDPVCTCAACVSACRRIPGIFHPLEALRAIRAGYADDMMAVSVDERRNGRAREVWRVMMPRSHSSVPRDLRRVHPHHRDDPFYASGRCVFLNVDERCEIHDSGFKPVECRAALLCDRTRAEGNFPPAVVLAGGPFV